MGISITLGEVVAGLLLLALVAWFWRGRGVRELALQHVQARCRSEGLQLLDAYVAFIGWRWLTSARGRGRLVRGYAVEFRAAGVERRSGWLAMHGRQLVSLELPPYPVTDNGTDAVQNPFRQLPGDDWPLPANVTPSPS